MSDETKMDAEDINELRRIQTEMNKCYQRAKETEKQMDWHIWNDMLEVWYSKCADSGEGLLRTIDALTAERDAARAELAAVRAHRDATQNVLSSVADALDALREACAGVPDMLDDAAKDYSPRFRAKADAIRAALGEDVQP